MHLPIPLDRNYLRSLDTSICEMISYPPSTLPLAGGPFFVFDNQKPENKRRKEENNMSERRKPKVGDAIVYHNERGVAHNGLITCVWGDFMINLLYVSSNESQKDDYGRQVIRESSVPMIGHPFGEPNSEGSCVHGRYARYPEEMPVQYQEPAAV